MIAQWMLASAILLQLASALPTPVVESSPSADQENNFALLAETSNPGVASATGTGAAQLIPAGIAIHPFGSFAFGNGHDLPGRFNDSRVILLF